MRISSIFRNVFLALCIVSITSAGCVSNVNRPSSSAPGIAAKANIVSPSLICGKVLDAATGGPVAGAWLDLLDLQANGAIAALSITDEAGEYQMRAKEGHYRLDLSPVPGYREPEGAALAFSVAKTERKQLPDLWLAPLRGDGPRSQPEPGSEHRWPGITWEGLKFSVTSGEGVSPEWAKQQGVDKFALWNMMLENWNPQRSGPVFVAGEQFKKITVGMSYAEVAGIIGQNGSVVPEKRSSSSSGERQFDFQNTGPGRVVPGTLRGFALRVSAAPAPENPSSGPPRLLYDSVFISESEWDNVEGSSTGPSTVLYRWDNRDGSIMIARFSNDKLVTKTLSSAPK